MFCQGAFSSGGVVPRYLKRRFTNYLIAETVLPREERHMTFQVSVSFKEEEVEQLLESYDVSFAELKDEIKPRMKEAAKNGY